MLEASEDDEEDDEDEDEDETDWDGVENDVLEYERIRRSETKPVEVKSWPKTLGECSSEENRDKVIFFTSEDMQSTRKALKKFWWAFHFVFFSGSVQFRRSICREYLKMARENFVPLRNSDCANKQLLRSMNFAKSKKRNTIYTVYVH